MLEQAVVLGLSLFVDEGGAEVFFLGAAGAADYIGNWFGFGRQKYVLAVGLSEA